MLWRIEIILKKGGFDAVGAAARKDILDLGIGSVEAVKVVDVYVLEGDISRQDADRIARELLRDPVTQQFRLSSARSARHPREGRTTHVIEIAYHPGVMDPVEASTLKGIQDLGISGVQRVRTARQYHIEGRLTASQRQAIVTRVLSNKLIQHEVPVKDRYQPSRVPDPRPWRVRTMDLLSADDQRLQEISRDGQLFLSLQEMKAVQAHFARLQRDPTDCELETIAQTWSEHCFHKTFRGTIEYRWTEDGQTKHKTIRNLLKTTIVQATKKINKPWCVSVFHDNAGVIAFDEDYHVCFKVETHNHPSALEPFGGANTGIGGVIRDILGTGLGAKPIANTDVFCFAPPETAPEDLPAGTLHPKRVTKGVVSGVRDYGNKMGIPTINGAVVFDPRFVGNPLVYCGSVGMIPRDKVDKKVSAGDLIVVVGGRTGRDGIHGATFSSGELTEESEVVSSGAVQIGDPIQEKKVLDALLLARDEGLYSAVTDCGAGGLSSAVGEMGAETGARVHLERVPLKYAGLNYEEIWISESQERMVLAVPPTHEARLLQVFADENVEATVIGTFSGTGRLELFYEGTQVCDLDMAFLHQGPPGLVKEAVWEPPRIPPARFPLRKDLTETLTRVLSHYNVCSKEWIIRQYDHEVQGGSVIKPLVGVQADGPSDASVIRPRLDRRRGLAVANGINPRYGDIDPFWMAASCVDEAVRQIIAVGGDVEKIAILDNFCWGNPDKPDRLGGLVRAAEGCSFAAVGYGVPFISGKDSLYNEYQQGGRSLAIPGTVLISSLGIIDDVTRTVTMDFKQPGNVVYCVGLTKEELGGSIYADVVGVAGGAVPNVHPRKGREVFQRLHEGIQQGWIVAAHDCSEGGLGVALAEMAFSGGWGVTADLRQVPYEGASRRDDFILFSESNTRFVVEVAQRDCGAFERLMGGSAARLGRVEAGPEVVIQGLDGEACVRAGIGVLKEAWQQPLRW